MLSTKSAQAQACARMGESDKNRYLNEYRSPIYYLAMAPMTNPQICRCLLFVALLVSCKGRQNKLQPIDEAYLKKVFASEDNYHTTYRTKNQQSKKTESPDMTLHILDLTTCEGGFSYFFGDCYGTDEKSADLKSLPPLTSSEFEKGTTAERILMFKQSYAYLKKNSTELLKKPYIDMNLNSLKLEFIREALYIQRTAHHESVDAIADELIDLYNQENEVGVGTEEMDVILDILRKGRSEKVKAFCKGKYFDSSIFYEDNLVQKAYEQAGDRDFRKYLKPVEIVE